MRHRTASDHVLLSAPTWIIRGSALAVVLTFAAQLVAAVGASSAPSGPDRAQLALVLAAPTAALPTLAALFRFRMRPDMLTAAEVLSLAVVACGGMMLTSGKPAPTPAPGGRGSAADDLVLMSALLLAAAGAVAIRAVSVHVGRTGVPPPAADALVVTGLVALVLSHVAGWRTGSDPGSVALVVGLSAVAVTAMSSGAAVGIARTVRDRDTRARVLQTHLTELESAAVDQRRTRHEVSNAVATIAMASNILHSSSDLPSGTRWRLEEMLEREAEHLTDLVGAPHHLQTSEQRSSRGGDEPNAPERPGPGSGQGSGPVEGVVDIDRALATVVQARREAGREIAWSPSGLRAAGVTGDVSRVVADLLDEAERDAPDAPVLIDVHLVEATVRIRILRAGPSKIRRGRRRAAAVLARRRALLGLHGGHLTGHRDATGATFTIGLPLLRPDGADLAR